MLGGQHGHLIGARQVLPVRVIADDRFHRLLVVLAVVVTVDVVALDVDHAGALAELAADLNALLQLIFVEAGRPVVRLHLGEAAPLGAGLGYSAIPVLVLFVGELDLRLDILVGVRVYLGYLVDYGAKING